MSTVTRTRLTAHFENLSDDEIDVIAALYDAHPKSTNEWSWVHEPATEVEVEVGKHAMDDATITCKRWLTGDPIPTAYSGEGFIGTDAALGDPIPYAESKPKGVNELISDANVRISEAMDAAMDSPEPTERELFDKAVGDTLKTIFDWFGIETPPDWSGLHEDGWLAYQSVRRRAELDAAVVAPLKRLEDAFVDRCDSLDTITGVLDPSAYAEARTVLAAVRREIKACTPPRSGDTLADGTVAA